ncbi:MAG: glycoside hydrolase domain-containing protein [Pirellulaceae bacterium]
MRRVGRWLWLGAILILTAACSRSCGARETLSSTTLAAPPVDVRQEEADGMQWRFAYFPSHHCVRFLLLVPPTHFAQWDLCLTAVGQAEVLARAEGKLPCHPAGETISVPPLADGRYELTLALTAGDGTRRELCGTFERHHFAWEGNLLGRDRIVIPPFTPLVVEESSPALIGTPQALPSSVACVLRRHELDGVGLWRQVTSQGHALLAEPMRLEIVSAGETHIAAGERVTFTGRADDRVEGQAVWTAGPLCGRTEFAFEYDGLMKVSLHIDPNGARLDGLQLVIPMKSAETWLMHPVTDLLRFHYAGRIPNGQGKLWDYGGQVRGVQYTETGLPDDRGKVWDSRHVGRWQLPGPFVPYIWLGGPERGICWFAENDRDWSLDPEQPVLEIRRRGETTELLVRFVTKPVENLRPRTLVFGLMATPAKPMPTIPADFRRWWAGSMAAETTDTVHFGLMGACYYWGAAGPCFAFYPAQRDFSIYDEFVRVRRSGQVDRSYTDRWLERFGAPEFAPHLETYRAHVNWTLNFFAHDSWRKGAAAGKTTYAIPYTNARAVNWGEEVRTFADEWSTLDVADPRWPGEERFLRVQDGSWALNAYGKTEPLHEFSGIAYATDPVASWQDMVMHYCRRMLETFADGIYYDDFFLAPNYNPLGPGYIDDQGQLRPGVNIFGFRELAKRTAVMQYQMGRRPLSFIHMTNTNIVPMLSFGTLLLDHEWRDQGDFREQDVHERLLLDEDTSLLLAQSTGLQSGCIGVIHDLFQGPQRPRFIRSGLAVALTHEMKFPLYWEELGRTTAEHLSNFGYGLPDCRVYRYWDEPSPVTTAGAPAKTLVLSRNGRAFVVLASYGPAGDVTLTLDHEKLGLPDDATAVNVETRVVIERTAPAQFKLALARHDFVLLLIE